MREITMEMKYNNSLDQSDEIIAQNPNTDLAFKKLRKMTFVVD